MQNNDYQENGQRGRTNSNQKYWLGNHRRSIVSDRSSEEKIQTQLSDNLGPSEVLHYDIASAIDIEVEMMKPNKT